LGILGTDNFEDMDKGALRTRNGDDEIGRGSKIHDILTDAGVMKMEIVMMNKGLKDCVVDVMEVVVEQLGVILDLLPNQDMVDSLPEVE